MFRPRRTHLTIVSALKLSQNFHGFHSSKSALFLKVPNDLKTNFQSVFDGAKNTIFGLMVRNMDEKEVKKFFNHWNEQLHPNLEESKVKEGENGKDVSSQKVESLLPEKKATPKNDELFQLLDNQKEIQLYHPLLGELLVDHGYKRIYSTCVHALAKTPVWKKQRILRPERAALIADDKIRRGISSKLPGIITLFQDEQTKEVGIIDGQHRLGALMILAQRGYWNARERNILIEVFSTTSEEDVAVLFRVINAAEPVRLIDMPDQLSLDDDDEIEEPEDITSISPKTPVAPTERSISHQNGDFINTTIAKERSTLTTTTSEPSSSSEQSIRQVAFEKEATPVMKEIKTSKRTRKSKRLSATQIQQIITEGTETIRSKYSEMFKPTSRCKAPHLNIDVFRDDLFTSDFLHLHHLETTEQFLQTLQRINEELHQQYQMILQPEDQYLRNYPKSFQNALKKAIKYHFYLGMDKQWIYDTSLRKDSTSSSSADSSLPSTSSSSI